MLASIVASRVTNNASVTNLAFVMLTEFVWRAELAIPAFTIVLANASTTTILTHAALTPMRADTTTTTIFTHAALTSMRAFVTLTFDFGTLVALQTCFQHFAESIHLEAVSEEALAASGTLNCIHSPVVDCIHMH